MCVCVLVTQSCPTLCDPIDCSPPGSSVHGDSPGRNTGVSCHSLFQRIFPTQGSNPCLLHWQVDSLPLSHQGSNTNPNYNEVSPHTGQNGHHQKKFANNKCWRRCGEKGNLLHCWLEWKSIQPLWRIVWKFLKEPKIELPCDPPILLLVIYLKTIISKDTYTPVFTEALFTLAKTWKQTQCPSTEEWIKKMWYVYTMKYYSAIKGMKLCHLQRHGWT